MSNSPSQMIPDMLDWRQIWRSGRPGKGTNGRIEAFTTGPLHANTIVITAETKSRFVAKDNLVPFRCSPVSSCAAPLQTEASVEGVKGSTRNGRHDPKCLSARCLRIVLEDTWALSEGATCTWMANDEAVGCTRALFTMWWTSRRLVYRGRPEPGLGVNDISRIHWSQHLLTTQSERPN
ncbi:uncharacterized protein TNCV_4874941 [Trichonephila clavipes]|nr:uncharacterized protein TNCV_4874941 [Trichonephila clavipes]